MLIPLTSSQPIKEPVLAIIRPVEKPKEAPKEPTLDEKIASNFYKCNTDLQWIRADNAQCLDKSQGYTENASQTIGFSSGAYGVGWCTSYAAARHPVPSNLGNADSWLYMARADGLATGYTPQIGAIAVARTYAHVAIVEKIDGERVYVSEQNYNGYGVVSSRWTSTSEWQGYIY